MNTHTKDCLGKQFSKGDQFITTKRALSPSVPAPACTCGTILDFVSASQANKYDHYQTGDIVCAVELSGYPCPAAYEILVCSGSFLMKITPDDDLLYEDSKERKPLSYIHYTTSPHTLYSRAEDPAAWNTDDDEGEILA